MRVAPGDPVEVAGDQVVAQQRRVGVALHHVEHVGFHILAGHVPGVVLAGLVLVALDAADVQALPLADGVVHQALVLAEHASVVERADLARLGRQVAHQELAERALADEADAGGILLGRDMQAGPLGDLAHLALVHRAEREQRLRQLRLVEAVEEVALVLGAVLGLQQLVFGAAVVGPFAHLGVVAGGDALGAHLHGVVEEAAELDLGVAQHVRIGRAPGLVLAQEVGEHAVLVLGAEVHHLELDADHVAHRRHIDQILPARAVLGVVIVLPVLHEQAGHVIALLLEQQRGHRRIHPAGHANHHLHSVSVLLPNLLTGHSVHLP